MRMIKNDERKQLEQAFPKGRRLILQHMEGEQYGPPIGAMGTIDFIDDAGQVHVKWDNGSSLAIIPEIDKVELVMDGGNNDG